MQQTASYSYRILLQGSGPWSSAPALPCRLITMDHTPLKIHLHTMIHPFPGPLPVVDLLRWLHFF